MNNWYIYIILSNMAYNVLYSSKLLIVMKLILINIATNVTHICCVTTPI